MPIQFNTFEPEKFFGSIIRSGNVAGFVDSQHAPKGKEYIYAVTESGEVFRRCAVQNTDDFNRVNARWDIVKSVPDLAVYIGGYTFPEQLI